MFKKITAVLFVLALVGCSSVHKEPSKYVEFQDSKTSIEGNQRITEKFFASGIQWNKDYVVTAKHASFIENSVYKAGGNTDVQFIKKSADNVLIPQWRNRVADESITVIGNSSTGKEKVVSGKDLNVSSGDDQSIVYVSSAPTVGGQSGAPVFGIDGKVIGMLVGSSNGINESGKMDSALNGKGKVFSIYIPYEVINKEWEKFNKK